MNLRKKPSKKLHEKEKMLVTSIFSFSPNVDYFIIILETFSLSSAKLSFNLDKAKILSFGRVKNKSNFINVFQ